MAVPGVGELLTTTLFNQEKEIQDAVSDNNALLMLMKEDGFVKTVPGGYELREPIHLEENPNAAFIEGYEEFAITPHESATALIFQPKEMVITVSISKREEMLNRGSEEQLFELVAVKIDNAKATANNIIDVALNSDGTAYSGKQFGGLQYLFPTSATTGTIGEITRSGNTLVQHTVRSTSTSLGTARSAANIKGELNIMCNALTRGKDQVTDILMDDTDYNYLLESLQAQQNFENAKLANAGFEALKYRGKNVHLNGGMGGNNPASIIWCINRKTLRWKLYRGANMSVLGPREPVNQLAAIRILYTMGNLTCNNPRLNGTLYA